MCFIFLHIVYQLSWNEKEEEKTSRLKREYFVLLKLLSNYSRIRTVIIIILQGYKDRIAFVGM